MVGRRSIAQPTNHCNMTSTIMAKKLNSPWAWIPSLYFGEGIPYVVAATNFSLIMYKQLGLSNADAAMYTSWLYLPWVIKPFWSPIVDILGTKRMWIWALQFLMGILMAGVAFCIPMPFFLQSTIALLWLVGFASATHDIAADGFYMLALDSHRQSVFVGIRSTFYRISMIVGQGALVILAGWLEQRLGNIANAWSYTFYGIAAFFILLAVYHRFVLPRPASDFPARDSNSIKAFFNSFACFFRKPGIWMAIAFILLYRLGEAQLVKMASPFMLDPVEKGGLGLTTAEVGVVYGTVGVICLTVGGILGGIYAAAKGLKNSLWLMLLCMNVPNLIYVALAVFQPENYAVVCAGVAVEQFGYGFGFTAFMLYMIYVCQGEYQTSHYAICTGIMALGMMLPGMVSGYIQEYVGYTNFFIWVCICTIPIFILCKWIKIDPAFGRK